MSQFASNSRAGLLVQEWSARFRRNALASRVVTDLRGQSDRIWQSTFQLLQRESAADGRRGFGFVIDVHAHEPETIYVIPIKSDSEHFPHDGALRVFRSRTGGNEWEPLTKGLPQGNCYVNVLRDAMAVDSLDPCGTYFGTTGGRVYASADAGNSWAPIVRDLPAVLSVEVQSLP